LHHFPLNLKAVFTAEAPGFAKASDFALRATTGQDDPAGTERRVTSLVIYGFGL